MEGQGVDMMRFDGDGLIEDYRVMVGPLSAVVALRDAAFSSTARSVLACVAGPPTGTGAVRGIPPPVSGQLFFNSSASITRMPLGPRT